MSTPSTLLPRRWQTLALAEWHKHKRRGIAAVVTGGGKTIFALQAIKDFRSNVPCPTVVITVPTEALLDQWEEEIYSFLNTPKSQVIRLTTKKRILPGRIHLGVINTVAQVAEHPITDPVFLIVDECHKAASEVFRKIFQIPTQATLGLSATPERQYDDGLEEVLIPSLGPIIYRYTYREAMEDKTIVPFTLHNIVFEFNEEEQAGYNKATKAIQMAIKKYGMDSPEALNLFLKRARFANASTSRIKIALRLVARHRNNKILIFHEDVSACEVINNVLRENGVASGVYHAGIPRPVRIETLKAYRAGVINVLVSCRALDEGFNVPETEIGIIAASTATHRQRVQRLGRVLRPAKGKECADIYSIVAAPPEIRRLHDEAVDMEGLAEVIWSRA
jgi:superfamily II DNA or RNA helicase